MARSCDCKLQQMGVGAGTGEVGPASAFTRYRLTGQAYFSGPAPSCSLDYVHSNVTVGCAHNLRERERTHQPCKRWLACHGRKRGRHHC